MYMFVCDGGCIDGAAQDCSETFNITGDRQIVLVNRSISHLCFQCLYDGVSYNTTIWTVKGVFVSDDTSAPGVEVVNGVLVLLNPMTLFMDGQSNGYEVDCEVTDIQRLTDIEIVSSGEEMCYRLSALIYMTIPPQLSSLLPSLEHHHWW